MAISPTATSPIDRQRDPATTMTPQSPVDNDEMAARRASARRTALIVAGIALAVYAGFMVLNVVTQ